MVPGVFSGDRGKCRAFPEMVDPRILWLESVGWKTIVRLTGMVL